MVQHVERRLGLLSGLAVAVLLACAPASAKAPPGDAGTASGKDGGTASAKPSPEPEAESSSGGSCSGKATFCGVYGQTFCSSQPGCSYSFATKTCGGLPIACEKATNQAFCKKIKGCKWK